MPSVQLQVMSFSLPAWGVVSFCLVSTRPGPLRVSCGLYGPFWRAWAGAGVALLRHLSGFHVHRFRVNGSTFKVIGQRVKHRPRGANGAGGYPVQRIAVTV